MGPLIGVTTYGVNRRGDFPLPRGYVDAVRRAGGVPVLLPAEGDDADALIPRLDALVLTGGGDVDPSHYGQQAHETIYGTDAARDRSDFAIVHAAITQELPILAICRGMQAFNVALGGTLHQHVPDLVGEDTLHRTEPPGPLLHDVSVDSSSDVASVIGASELTAMSWHHQAVDELGKGLSAVATAPDGIVEALALDGHRWCLIVQWHPELSADTDPTQQALFDGLVEASGTGGVR